MRRRMKAPCLSEKDRARDTEGKAAILCCRVWTFFLLHKNFKLQNFFFFQLFSQTAFQLVMCYCFTWAERAEKALDLLLAALTFCLFGDICGMLGAWQQVHSRLRSQTTDRACQLNSVYLCSAPNHSGESTRWLVWMQLTSSKPRANNCCTSLYWS